MNKNGNNILRIRGISVLFMLLGALAFSNYTYFKIASVGTCFVFYIIDRIGKAKVKRDATLEYFVWYGVFVLFTLISRLWIQSSNDTFNTVFRAEVYVLVEGILIISFALKDKNSLKKLYQYYTIAGLVLCLRMLVQVPTSAWGSERIGNYIGYGPVGAANVLSYTSVITFDYATREKNKRYYLYAIILTVFSLLTGTRKAVFIPLIGFTMLIVLRSENRRKIVRNILIIVSLIGIGFVVIMRIPSLYGAIGYRMEELLHFIEGTGRDASARVRVLLMQEAITVWKQHPILGIGLDGFRHVDIYLHTYAHNNYLELLADLGLVGFFIYYLGIFKALLSSAKDVMRRNNRSLSCLALLASILVMDFATVSYYAAFVQIMVIFSMASLAAAKTETRNDEKR